MKVRTLLSYVAATALALTGLVMVAGPASADTFVLKRGGDVWTPPFWVDPTLPGYLTSDSSPKPDINGCKWTFSYQLVAGLDVLVPHENNNDPDVGRLLQVTGSPTAAGAVSISWTLSNGPEKKCDASGSVTLTSTMIPAQVTLTYHTNGGTLVGGNPGTHPNGYVETLASATKAGYTFGGWDTNPASTTVVYVSGYALTLNANTDLYAVWAPVGCTSNCYTYEPPGTVTDNTKYTLSFDANGGTGAPAAITVNAWSMFMIPMTAPTRSCYVFKGWSPDPGATWALYDLGAGFTAMKNMTVYAVWAADKACDPKPVVTPTPTPTPTTPSGPAVAPKLTCSAATTTVVSVEPGKVDFTVTPASAKMTAAGNDGIGGTHVAGSTLKFFAKPGFSGKASIKLTATNDGLTASCDLPVLVQVAPVVKPYFTPIRIDWSSIVWVASPNATGYKVYANGKQVCGVTAPRCDVKTIYGPADEIQVKAVGNDGTEAPFVPAAYSPDSLVYIGSVNFDENSQAFNPAAKKQLAALLAIIEKHGFTKVKSVGNTDNQGGSRNAMALSKARAAAVAKWLKGKSDAELTTYYYANNWAIAPNSTKDGQAKNRRVEVSVK